MSLNVIQLDPNAQFPAPEGAGYDLFSNAEYVIQPGGRAVISTGLGINFPKGTYGRITSRTGLSVKHGVTVLADVIDPGYTDEIKIVMHNTDQKKPFVIHQGYRVARLIVESYLEPTPFV